MFILKHMVLWETRDRFPCTLCLSSWNDNTLNRRIQRHPGYWPWDSQHSFLPGITTEHTSDAVPALADTDLCSVSLVAVKRIPWVVWQCVTLWVCWLSLCKILWWLIQLCFMYDENVSLFSSSAVDCIWVVSSSGPLLWTFIYKSLHHWKFSFLCHERAGVQS